MTYLQSPKGETPVIVEGVFNVSPQRLFRAWADPGEMIQWFAKYDNKLGKADMDFQVGGTWKFVLAHDGEPHGWFEGEYLEIKQNALIVFTWVHVAVKPDGLEKTPPSQVTAFFTPLEPLKTRLTVRHEYIKTEAGRLGVTGGWEACFANLEALREDAQIT